MLDDFDDETLKARFGLNYHVTALRRAEFVIGLSGQRVLEMGGGLPRELVLDILGAARWTGLESKDYWRYFGKQEDIPAGGSDIEVAAVRNSVDASVLDQGSYTVVECPIELLPAAFDQKFDRIFSVAAFEHLNRLPAALDRMHEALVPGGRLFAVAAPLWSSAVGHHLSEIRDAEGRVWSQGNVPIPAWGHLVMRPSQMLEHLAAHTDTETAREIVYQIYHTTFINRLFTEDYIELIKQSPFHVVSLRALYQREISPDAQSLLEQLHPGRANFSNEGLEIILERKP